MTSCNDVTDRYLFVCYLTAHIATKLEMLNEADPTSFGFISCSTVDKS